MTVAVYEDVKSGGTLVGATMLVSGTCIGGGMLALPIQTAETGFLISSFYLIFCWAFMTLSGLFLAEATLWIKKGAHYSSLSRILVGRHARPLVLVIYFFMNYASLVAYTTGGAQLVHLWAKKFFNISLETHICSILFATTLSLIVYFGAKFVGKMNTMLMVGLGLAYLALIGMGMGIVEGENLFCGHQWFDEIGVFSVILSAFSYQMIVPSVCSYLDYDAKKLKKAIVLGTLIPCVVYFLWQFVIHGAVPLDGEHGLREAFRNGTAATRPLSHYFKHWTLVFIADTFAFLAVATSFLGLSLALFQFLEDCFKEFKVMIHRGVITLFSIIPVVILSVVFPRALIVCFDLTGGFGDTILSGLLPIAMVWQGRYVKGYQDEFKVPGGKIALVLSAFFFAAILLGEIVKVFG